MCIKTNRTPVHKVLHLVLFAKRATGHTGVFGFVHGLWVEIERVREDGLKEEEKREREKGNKKKGNAIVVSYTHNTIHDLVTLCIDKYNN